MTCLMLMLIIDINADINAPPGNVIQLYNKGLHAVTKLVLKIP